MGKSKAVVQRMVAIKNALASFEDGASIEEIRAASGLHITIRTLQRHLAELIQAGIIVPSGHTRSTRYHLAQPGRTETGMVREDNAPYGNDLLPLGTESKKIRSA